MNDFPDLREPNALDALAYVGMKICEYGAYCIIGAVLCAFWIATSEIAGVLP